MSKTNKTQGRAERSGHGYEVWINGVNEIVSPTMDGLVETMRQYNGIENAAVLPLGRKVFPQYKANPSSRTCHHPYGFIFHGSGWCQITNFERAQELKGK